MNRIKTTCGRCVGLWLALSVSVLAAGCGSMHQGLNTVQHFEYESADALGDFRGGMMGFGENTRDQLYQW